MIAVMKFMWDRAPIDLWACGLFIFLVYLLYALKDYIRSICFILTLSGPPAVPFLGNAGYVLHDDLLYKMSHLAHPVYGPIFRLWLTIFPFVVLLEPDDIQRVLGNPRHTSKVFFYKLLHNFLGKGLITSDVTTWRVHRRILQPAFHLHVLEKFVGSFNHSSQKLVESFLSVDDDGTDITSMVNNSVYEILNETVLGNACQRAEDSPFRKGQVSLSHRLTHPWLLLDWVYRRTTAGKREQNHHEELFNVCKKKIKLNNRQGKTSLLEFMKDLSNKNHYFGEEDILNQCCTFMLAGQDSVGSATALSLFMLAKHEDWQAKCVKELTTIFGDDARDPTIKDLREMRCLEMCIKETMRLYPSVPLFARTLGEDVKLGKYRIPRGCGVIIMPYSTHRLPHHYPNPHEFHPERFNFEHSTRRHSYAYLPFSAGPRNCIGYKFALLEMKSIISAVLRRCHLALVPGKDEAIPKFRVTVRVKGGVWIKIRPRDYTKACNSPRITQSLSM